MDGFEVLRVAWIIWTALWILFIITLLIFVLRWDRAAVGNLIFHLAAGVLVAFMFWAGWYDWYGSGGAAWGLGFWIVLVYSYEFVWRPLTNRTRRLSQFKKRLPID